MRFISKSQRFKISAVKGKVELITGPSGTYQEETKKPYIAHFTQGGATPAEAEMAMQRFKFTGLGDREDPRRRISVFDTDEFAYREGWAPEFKAQVEKALLEGQDQFYFLAETPAVAIPWAAYDTAEEDEILATAQLIGADLNHVLSYEKANANRPSAIKALEQSIVPAEVEVSA